VDGRLTVRNIYSKNQLFIAYIVPNGKAPGARNPAVTSVGNLQGLIVDPAKDFYKIIKLVEDPAVVTSSPGSGGGTGTVRLIKTNDYNSSVYSCWIYTMDSSYDNSFTQAQLASGDSGIPVYGALSYFSPPAGLTLHKEVDKLYRVLVNKDDYYDLHLPRGRYLITWLKTSTALHYGYDNQNWFVLDMPSHSGSNPIELKVDTSGVDLYTGVDNCSMRF
jgi:hypothetical protein